MAGVNIGEGKRIAKGKRGNFTISVRSDTQPHVHAHAHVHAPAHAHKYIFLYIYTYNTVVYTYLQDKFHLTTMIVIKYPLTRVLRLY